MGGGARALVWLLALLLLGAVACQSLPPVSTEPIKVGAYFGITGDTDTFGLESVNGIRLALEQLNAKGGVLGRKFELQVQDTRGQLDKTTAAVEKLIDDGADVLIGEAKSTNSIAGGMVAQQHGVPMVSNFSTNPKVTVTGDYIFRVCFTDEFQGSALAKFAVETLHARRAVVFTDRQSDYAIGLSRYFRDAFEKKGGKVVGEETYIQEDTDFKRQVRGLAGLHADVIFIPGYFKEAAQIARQVRQLGYSGPLLGGDGWDSPKLIGEGGSALDNSYYSVHVDLTSADKRVQAFVRDYQTRFHAPPDTLAALGYDSMMLVGNAYGRAGAVDKKKMRDALAATRDFPGVTGTITMGADRNPVKALVVLKIQEGKASPAATVNP